jgi:flagellar basal body-associated protein FliL
MRALSVVFLVLTVLVAGVLAVRYGGGFRLSMPPAPAPPKPEATGFGDVGPVVRFEPVVISEADGDNRHMSTVTFEVEVTDAAGRDAVKARTSQVRSEILTLLADTKLNDIGDPEGLAILKKRVQDRVQSVLPDHVIRRVLITEFLIL